MYGLISKQHLKDMVIDVVNNLGGDNHVVNLLLETAQVESRSGTYPYNPFRNYGLGVMQFDKIAFDDIKARTRNDIKEKILNIYGLDINKLEYSYLRFSPLISVIFARLHYRLIPDKVPNTKELRAYYWYNFYNRAEHIGQEIQVKKYLKANKG